MSLLVVGTVAFDAIETPFGKTDKIVGGAATYIGLSASKFYDKINLVSVVGEDFPREAIDMMDNHKINTVGLQIKENEKTFFWSGRYHNDMNSRDTLDTQLNVLEKFNPVVPNSYQDCDCLMLGNLMPSIQQKVLDQLHKRPKLIVLDTMNFWMDNFMDDLMIALKSVDVLTINDEEARQLSGEYSLVKAAKKIISFGPKVLVIKKGEHGALLFNEKEIFSAPALPLEEVFDPTGAGDTFAGGFVGYLSTTKDYSFENMKKAVVIGSVMASFCVEKFGTERMSGLNIQDVKDRISQFVELVQFDIQLL
ncbi:MAG: sugar kinase [Flavobacteriales bacterium]|nr:sugar kinase [Flavobacteriales bacterium]|tara:strand:+ start:3699 stop:4622 length:924 start_codon:yes stop_codon:yes gene_type:complete